MDMVDRPLPPFSSPPLLFSPPSAVSVIFASPCQTVESKSRRRRKRRTRRRRRLIDYPGAASTGPTGWIYFLFILQLCPYRPTINDVCSQGGEGGMEKLTWEGSLPEFNSINQFQLPNADKGEGFKILRMSFMDGPVARVLFLHASLRPPQSRCWGRFGRRSRGGNAPRRRTRTHAQVHLSGRSTLWTILAAAF